MVETLSPILGKARMTITGNTTRIQIDDYDSEGNIDFVEIDPKGSRIGSSRELHDRQVVLLTTEDRYWVFSDDIISGYREKFGRTANQARGATE